MSKPPEQRKFGLMGCDHCFCLGCIRSWRSQSGADLDTVSGPEPFGTHPRCTGQLSAQKAACVPRCGAACLVSPDQALADDRGMR